MNLHKLSDRQIPKEYLLTSINTRIDILSGLIDSNAQYHIVGNYYTFNIPVLYGNLLYESILHLLYSLGINGIKIELKTNAIKTISGEYTSGMQYEIKLYIDKISYDIWMMINTKVKNVQKKCRQIIKQSLYSYDFDIKQTIVKHADTYTLECDISTEPFVFNNFMVIK
jgi:hypothetical protein